MVYENSPKRSTVAGSKGLGSEVADEPETGGRSLDQEDIDSDVLDKLIDQSKKFWATTSDKTVFWGSSDVSHKLRPGLYKAFFSDNTGYGFRRLIVSTDDLIVLEDSPTYKVLQEINRFWSEDIRKEYDRRGFLHKRGIMMYGDPGSGKTAVIQMLVKKLIEMDGVAIYADDPQILTHCLQLFRKIEPTRPAVVILEDFETLTDRQHKENEWLSMLDGEAQIDNVVFLATTNYIEKLDKRFTDRPSRFDLVVPIPNPPALVRAKFLRIKEPDLTLDEIKEWVKLTKNYSIAHLKELIISVRVLGKDITTEVERLNKMKERKFTNEEFKNGGDNKFGFHTAESPLASNETVNWDEFAKEHGFAEEK